MCDTLAIVRNDRTLFAKNSDREHDEPQLLEFVPARVHAQGAALSMTHATIAQAPHTNAIVISRPYWIWGAEIGANSHGLTIGNEAIFTNVPATSAPGVIGMDFVRLALERASTVEEGVTIITSLLELHGQGGNCSAKDEVCYHNSYLLADPAGASILETVGRDWVVRSIQTYDAISNAITTGRDYARASLRFQDSEPGERPDFRATFHDPAHEASPNFRRGRALACIGALSEPDVRGVFSILRDHAPYQVLPDRAPARICAHAEKSSLGQTTASWVADLTADHCIHWVTGVASPCTAVFKPVILALGLPDQGHWPERGPDDNSLWWRHDRFYHRLRNSPAGTQAAFDAERDSLEARFVRKVNATAMSEDKSAVANMDAVVASCWREANIFEQIWFEKLDK